MSQPVEASNRLIVYGSLMPGGPNHSLLETLGGEWTAGHIEGDLVEGGWGSALGYPAYLPRPGGPRVRAFLLHSSRLDAEAWQMLDDFEGSAYRRIVVPFFPDSGKPPLLWGQVYASA